MRDRIIRSLRSRLSVKLACSNSNLKQEKLRNFDNSIYRLNNLEFNESDISLVSSLARAELKAVNGQLSTWRLMGYPDDDIRLLREFRDELLRFVNMTNNLIRRYYKMKSNYNHDDLVKFLKSYYYNELNIHMKINHKQYLMG